MDDNKYDQRLLSHDIGKLVQTKNTFIKQWNFLRASGIKIIPTMPIYFNTISGNELEILYGLLSVTY